MASRREQEIDHILRRAGFGATQEEVDIYARLAFGGTTFALARLLSYKQIDDVVDDNIGKPGYVAITARGRVPPDGEHRRRAPALAVPDGPYRAPSAGKDGAVLAQPLRDRLHQDCG